MCYHSSHPSMLYAPVLECTALLVDMNKSNTSPTVPNQHAQSSVLNTRLVYSNDYNFSWIECKC